LPHSENGPDRPVRAHEGPIVTRSHGFSDEGSHSRPAACGRCSSASWPAGDGRHRICSAARPGTAVGGCLCGQIRQPQRARTEAPRRTARPLSNAGTASAATSGCSRKTALELHVNRRRNWQALSGCCRRGRRTGSRG